jgi:hypothetical protein
MGRPRTCALSRIVGLRLATEVHNNLPLFVQVPTRRRQGSTAGKQVEVLRQRKTQGKGSRVLQNKMRVAVV